VWAERGQNLADEGGRLSLSCKEKPSEPVAPCLINIIGILRVNLNEKSDEGCFIKGKRIV
jgi:hypothetical protein